MKSTKDKYLIYKYDRSKKVEKPDCIDDMRVKRFSGKRALKADILFSIASFFRQRVLLVFDKEGKFVHYSYIVPKCKKFPFLKKDDVLIGPCFTEKSFRGKGVYPYILTSIAELYTEKKQGPDVYVVVRNNNGPSNRGIEKGSFVVCGEVYKSMCLKHYKYVEWYK